jgi:hypothetical protein
LGDGQFAIQDIPLGLGAQSKGGTSGNAINGISEANPSRAKFLEAAKREFGAVKEGGKALGAISIPAVIPSPLLQRSVADFLEAIQK